MMTSVKLARTGAVDPKTGRVYLPTREAWSRPTPKPGTFVVLGLIADRLVRAILGSRPAPGPLGRRPPRHQLAALPLA